jgi:ATP-binding cassette subfamily F protein 3
VGLLSGGERARLMLTLATLDSPNLLILDEPTNHLDIDAREQLLVALNDFDGAVVLVSHDRRLIEATIDRLLLVANGTVRTFDGDLDDYRRQILSPAKPAREKRNPVRKEDTRRSAAERRAQLKPLREEAIAAEQEVARLTRDVAEYDAALSAPTLHKREPSRASELSRQRTHAMRALTDAETHWLAASQAYEDASAKE